MGYLYSWGATKSNTPRKVNWWTTTRIFSFTPISRSAMEHTNQPNSNLSQLNWTRPSTFFSVSASKQATSPCVTWPTSALWWRHSERRSVSLRNKQSQEFSRQPLPLKAYLGTLWFFFSPFYESWPKSLDFDFCNYIFIDFLLLLNKPCWLAWTVKC